VLARHARDIPTLSQYTYYLSPSYHAFATRLLGDPTDRPNVNHIVMSRVDVRLMRMLGLRCLMIKDNLDRPGLTRVDRQGEYRLYELPDSNLGSYSPTRVHQEANARGRIDRLADPSFDPRLDVATTLDMAVTGDLLPATDTSLTFVRGGFQFTGRSACRSLVVLPVQYTRCLDVRTIRGSGVAARVIRVNLVQAGLLFSGDAEVDGRFHFGGPWERCLADEVADIDRLHIRDLVERHREPGYTLPGPRFHLFEALGLD
jgi:hypothetical protein